MKTKKECMYTKSHEWVQFLSDDTARVGLSDYAQEKLGNLVFISLPEVDDEVNAGEGFADVESVKAVSTVYTPISGIVTAINEDLLDTPELVNNDAYEAWMVEIGQISKKNELMNVDEYEAFCAEEG